MEYHQLYVHDSRASLRAVFTLLKYTMPAPFLGLIWADRVVGGPGVVATDFVEARAALAMLGGALVVVGGALVVVCERAGPSRREDVTQGEKELSAIVKMNQAGMQDSATTCWHAARQECACRWDPGAERRGHKT